jgi:mannitol/fructose-specific phosphotransferase system IIA component
MVEMSCLSDYLIILLPVKNWAVPGLAQAWLSLIAAHQAFKKIHGCLVKLTHPVDFDAIDDQPVDLIFALVVPEEKNDEHLNTLARIVSIMQNDDYRQRLRSCAEDATLFNTVLELERGNNL